MSPVRSLQNIWTRWPSFLSGEVEIDSLGGRGDVRQDLPLLHLIIFQREVISDDVKDKFRRAGSIAEQFKCLWNSQVIPILKKLNFSRLWSMSLWTIRGKKAKYYFCSTTYLPKAERYNDKDKKNWTCAKDDFICGKIPDGDCGLGQAFVWHIRWVCNHDLEGSMKRFTAFIRDLGQEIISNRYIVQ